jgi:hypothetical protein
MVEPVLDIDSPWKDLAERYLPALMAFFFPAAHAEIDWARGHEFLDTELRQIVRDAELGRRLADKLVRVWWRDRGEIQLLIHIEVQGRYDAGFAERMYVYNYRTFDRFRRPVLSFAILDDQRPRWRPRRYGYRGGGFDLSMRFPIAKLLDYRRRWDELEASTNPFAIAVMAHLQALATRGRPLQRLEWKKRLVRRLYDLGFERQDILELFRFIDWLLALPEELQRAFWTDLQTWEEERRMPYITSVERFGREAGLQQGHLEMARTAVLDALEIRFGEVQPAVRAAIEALDDAERLRDLHKRAITIPSPADFEAILRADNG